MIEALLQKCTEIRLCKNLTAHKETQNEVDLQNQGVNETKNTTWTVNWKLS